jgi:threonine aldolase
MTIVDLRSDTVTKPSPEMRRAMSEAEVGDDVFGDDPTVIRLQERAAELLGKEAALYVPSGTMANQIAVACHTRPGDEVLCEAGCHVLNFEGGAPAHLSGVLLTPIEGRRGIFTAEQAEERIRPLSNHHYPPARLLWVENSHNRAGGTIFPMDEIQRLRQLADRHKLAFHLDGARIWNVAAATGKPESWWTQPFDTVNACFSKGLGAPVGSVTAGSKDYIEQAHRIRKRLGGGMRQAGIIAAGALYALEHNRARLVEDHARARRLAEAIAELPAFSIDLEAVQTNIVIFDAAPGRRSGAEVVETLKSEGVWGTSFGRSKVRLVTHLDVDDRGIERAINILRKHFSRVKS